MADHDPMAETVCPDCAALARSLATRYDELGTLQRLHLEEHRRLAEQLDKEIRARKALESELARLRESRSWKLTAPLRAFSRRLRG